MRRIFVTILSALCILFPNVASAMNAPQIAILFMFKFIGFC